MKSAGNDIVALQYIDKQRTYHSAFYSKFITVSEQALYEQSRMPFENFVWLLWSIKEAVYKYLKRYHTDLIFSPSKIIIQNIEELDQPEANDWLMDGDYAIGLFCKGKVLFNANILYFRSKLHEEFIATVVNGEERFSHTYWGVQQIGKPDHETQSEKVRLLVLNRLKQLFPANELRIEKLDGYPVLLIDDEVVDIPISLAHHGCFVAYSFLFEN